MPHGVGRVVGADAERAPAVGTGRRDLHQADVARQQVLGEQPRQGRVVGGYHGQPGRPAQLAQCAVGDERNLDGHVAEPSVDAQPAERRTGPMSPTWSSRASTSGVASAATWPHQTPSLSGCRGGDRTRQMTVPPSTGSTWPVMEDAGSEAGRRSSGRSRPARPRARRRRRPQPGRGRPARSSRLAPRPRWCVRRRAGRRRDRRRRRGPRRLAHERRGDGRADPAGRPGDQGGAAVEGDRVEGGHQ